jgi:hypothetical protein
MKKDILKIIGFILLLAWSIVGLVSDIKNPPSIDDLTVQERIKYEQMIFP